MNRNRLLMIGAVALALAGCVTYLMYAAYRNAQANNNKPQPLVTVVAAATDLAVGTRLEEKDLRLVQLPPDNLPAGVFHQTSELAGRGVLMPMSKGELVLNSKVAGENAGAGMPSIIPAGMRAVSVKVNDVVSVAGFVIAGTRVDVLLTGNLSRDNDPARITTTTVLENVQVLAAGQKLQKNENGEPQQVTVITLLVNPDDAQKLVLAGSEGHIQLALRNPLDTVEPSVPALQNVALYHLPAVVEAPRLRRVAKATPKPAAPLPFVVELIKGDKRDSAKF
jgi:pilus assembly protein CpaB